MPAAPAAPPPSKPSVTPSVSPPPAGGGLPPIHGNHEPAPESYLGDIGEELGSMDTTDQESKKSSDRPRDPTTKKFVKAPLEEQKQPQDEPEPEKAVETPTQPEKPVEEPKPNTMAGLGKLYDKLKKERDTVLQPKLQSLEAKTKEYERTIEELKKSAPDVKPIQERIAAIEQENKALREVVRFSDYRQSPEFKDKYEKPYNEAWSKAVGEVTQLSLSMEDGTIRKATANDLLALANAPLDQLDDLAAQWFPKSSPRVIRHVEKIRDLAEQQDKALEEAKKGATEFQTKRMQEAQQQNGAFSSAFTGATAELTKKYPKWFAPDEADPKGNEILKKGFEYADTVLTPNSQLTPEQRAGRLAVLRAKAANHDRLAAKVKAHSARIVELEAELAKFEASEPPTSGESQPSSPPSADWQSEVEAELRKLER